MERSIKILAITNLFPNCAEKNRGVFNRQQFRYLDRLCQLKVVAPLPLIKYSSRQVPMKEIIDEIETYHPRYLVIPKTLRSLYGYTFFLGILRTIYEIKKNFTFEVIFSTWAYPDAFGAYLAARMLKKPLVIKVHGSDVNILGQFPLRRRMMMAAFRYAYKIIAVSEPLKQKIVEWGIPSEKVVVVSNGVNTELFHSMKRAECRKKLSLSLSEKIVLYVGNLEPVKGPDILIEAFKKMPAGVKLMMIGKGGMEKSLKEKVKLLSMEDRVFFLGSKPHNELPVWFNAVDIFCLASRNEGCPNVILEALACQVPVVATRVGGIPELMTESAGEMVEPQNPEALAYALINQLAKDDLKTEVKIMSWQENAQNIFSILKESRNEILV
ncbi:MAG: glycosyltransferase family 4 protein [Candidatus Omnitrophica bacterium]|nr:glycosyltransferase family 4 protein [Candidatus Omnitrophota bacterium]MDE2213824.1 glycosyltransferase family 4 protein [Candidatus Omnitrophota bacterium]